MVFAQRSRWKRPSPLGPDLAAGFLERVEQVSRDLGARDGSAAAPRLACSRSGLVRVRHMIRRNLYSWCAGVGLEGLASASLYKGRESMKGVRLITIGLAALLVLGGLLGVTASAGAARGTVAVSPEVAPAETAEEAAETAMEANEAAEEAAIPATMREFPDWHHRIRHLKQERTLTDEAPRIGELPPTERHLDAIDRKTEKIHKVRARLVEVRHKFRAKKKEIEGKS